MAQRLNRNTKKEWHTNPRSPLRRASHSTTSLQFSSTFFMRKTTTSARQTRSAKHAGRGKHPCSLRVCREPRPPSACLCLHEREKNRSSPSYPSLCFKARVSAKPLIWKLFYIFMQTKLIFTKKVLHFASFWKREFLELGNSLFLLFCRLLGHVSPSFLGHTPLAHLS